MNIYSTVRHSLAFIREAVFPLRCCSCGAWGESLCSRCTTILPPTPPPRCPLCAEPSFYRLCAKCAVSACPLDALCAALPFEDARVRRLIHTFKYGLVRELATPLGTVLAQALIRSALPLPTHIIPLPLHPHRHRWRGFNQAEELAHTVAKLLAPPLTIPVLSHLLRRSRATTPQAQITRRAARITNIAGAFCASQAQAELSGAHVLLIDDVMTTGATLVDAARALKEAGVRTVTAAVLARDG